MASAKGIDMSKRLLVIEKDPMMSDAEIKQVIFDLGGPKVAQQDFIGDGGTDIIMTMDDIQLWNAVVDRPVDDSAARTYVEANF
jgi:hypothetical protein